MGWAIGDPEKVAQLKVKTAQARQACYPLIRGAKEITHPEKGPQLVKLTEQLYELLNTIDLQLSR